MLEDLDAEVGRLMKEIDEVGLADQTVVVFVSDNGGFEGAAHMGPLRGAKTSTSEGGIRVPLIVRWPGRIEPGTVSGQVSITFDLTASVFRLVESDVPNDKLDGYDIIQHVSTGRDDFPRTLFWRGRRGDTTWWAVRDGDLKYVRKSEGDRTEEWLFDLATDVGEERNLLAKDSTADRLKRLLVGWETEVKPTR